MTATDFNANTGFFIDEVKRHLSLQLGVLVNAQEIHVHNQLAFAVTLNVFQNYVFRLAVDIQSNNVRIERFVFQRFCNVFMDQLCFAGIFLAAIHNCWYFTGQTTQAAARTFPCILTTFRL